MCLNEAPFDSRVLGVLCLRICITKHTCSLTFLPPPSIIIWHSYKNMETPLGFWLPTLSLCYRSFGKAFLTALHKCTCWTRSPWVVHWNLCHAPKSQKAFQKHDCLDIAGALLATLRVWWLFSVPYLLAFVLHCSLSPLVPQQTDLWWMAHSGS